MKRHAGLVVLGLVTALGLMMAGQACDDTGSSGSGGAGAGGPGTGGGATTTTTTTTSTMGPGGAGGSGGSGGSGAGPAASYCGRTCTVPADCCPPGVPNCPSNQYPTNFTCDNGLCGPPRCAVKDDCTVNGTQPNRDCVQINSLPSCATVCTTNADCTAPATCMGMADDGTMLCQAPDPGPFMCDDDADCNGLGKCNAAGDGCYCDSSADCMNEYLKDCIQ